MAAMPKRNRVFTGGNTTMLESLGLSGAAAAVYQAMLDRPGAGVAALATNLSLTAGQVHAGLEELAALLLVRASSQHPGQMRAVSPEVGLADMLAHQEAELAARQAQLAASRVAVNQLVADRAESRTSHGERLLGMDAIQARLEELARGARAECLGVHPGTRHRPEDLAAAQGANAGALARGIVIRSLYQDAVRNVPHTVAHASWVLDHGGEIRTAPVIPQRLVIVDRAQALVPIDPADTRKGALHVTEPGLVGALCELFDLAWATAVPLGATRTQDTTTGLSGTERELLRLLGSGLTDDTAGQRLGVSSRTVNRLMASIMERLDASSRFEAGIKAARRDWL